MTKCNQCGAIKITWKEWNKTHNDYKTYIAGQPYKMLLDKQYGTILAPVMIIDDNADKQPT